jgi:hypothetical protein
LPVFAHCLPSYPQFKKVFSFFPVKIHTICAQRFRDKYFARIVKLQNAIWQRLVGISMQKKQAGVAFTPIAGLFRCLSYENYGDGGVPVLLLRVVIFRNRLFLRQNLFGSGFRRSVLVYRLTRMSGGGGCRGGGRWVVKSLSLRRVGGWSGYGSLNRWRAAAALQGLDRSG